MKQAVQGAATVVGTPSTAGCHAPRSETASETARRTVASLRESIAPLLSRRGIRDTALAVTLAAASLAGGFADLNVDLPEGGGDVDLRALDAGGIGLILLQTVPLSWRTRAPVAVLGVTGVALFLFIRVGYSPSLASFGFLIALYTVAGTRPRRISVPAGVVSYMGVLTILALGRERFEPDAVLAEFLIVGAAWWLGDGLRIRRSQLVQLEDRAALLEREREERAERAVAEERRVIARELHDVVAHNVSIIVAQAGAAQRIFDAAPREALGVLGTIERIGREALVEMRRLMGFLRTEQDDSTTRAPQPGLRHLDALVAQIEEAGVPVTLRMECTPRPLPVGLDLSAFRIVQEALTNVLKHAGPARVDVLVRYTRERLELMVSDDGRGSRNGSSRGHDPGYGQLGMRERVALFGGVLRFRSRPEGGYQVWASLPLEAAPT